MCRPSRTPNLFCVFGVLCDGDVDADHDDDEVVVEDV